MSLLQVRHVRVSYASERGDVAAVDDVSLTIEPGEVLGLAGESACGKTTLALAVPRLLPETASVTGGVTFEGRDLLSLTETEMRTVRWKGISVVFQGAMNALNPCHTVGHQIMEPIRLHEPGTTARAARARVGELLEQVGIPASRAAAYPHEFSGGMRQRVMIAMALACRPRLVIADEPATALDVMTQAQILNLLRQLQRDLGLAMILISHDLSVLAEICDRVAIMYAGAVVESGPGEVIFGSTDAGLGPVHPYTRSLLRAFPNIRRERTFVEGIPGYPPDLAVPLSGCRFYERCSVHIDVCRTISPELLRTRPGHLAACHLVPPQP